jgi:putative flippase GtrA
MGKVLKNEKIRFVLAGCFNTGLDFILLNILVGLAHFAPILANTISVSVGITISYFLNHYFVFASKEKISLKKYAVFFAVTGFSSLIIQNLIIGGFEIMTDSSWGRSLFLIQELGHHETLELNIAKVIAVATGMVWNFLLYKYVIFKKKPDESLIEMEEEFQK